jgi:hypothetical protein
VIDYQKIADSIIHFKNRGYVRVEAPWWASEDVIRKTYPTGDLYYIPKNGKALVGSAEQSFLYMGTKGRLPDGKYQAVTPCFRDESIGTFHRKCFIKNELIIVNPTNVDKELNDIIQDALAFFTYQLEEAGLYDDLIIKQTEIGFDIETTKGIELGSYGYRRCEFMDWIYGTACAEPRLTRAIKHIYLLRGKNAKV